jgi:DNA-binding CsgD family transcriptional regulator/PAS domain-containing protein
MPQTALPLYVEGGGMVNHAHESARQVIELIYHALLEPELWGEVMARAASALGSHGGGLWATWIPSGEVFFTEGLGAEPSMVSMWRSRFASPENNPYIRMVATRPELDVITTEMLPSFELPEFREFVEVVIEPLEFHQYVGSNLLLERDLVAMASFYRSKGRRPFARADREFYRILARHLRQAVLLRKRMRSLEHDRDSALGALDRLATAVVLLDAAGKALFVNRVAEGLLHASDGLVLRHGSLEATSAADRRELSRILDRALSKGAFQTAFPASGATLVSRPSGRRPFEVIVAPLRSKRLRAGPSATTAAVFVSDPEQTPVAARDVLVQLFHLTPAEATLAQIVARGRGLPEAAAELGISFHTARTHLYRVLAKTCTRRQSELVRLLCALPLGLRLD